MIARRAEELRLAFLLLSRLPVGALRGAAPLMAAAVWAFPLVGLVIGGVMTVVLATATGLGLTPAMAALLALAAGALASGAMHEDGLADLADGFGGGRGRARKLEIMRDSRIGSYGVIALVLALGFRGAAIAALAGGPGFALIGIAAASRAVLPFALAWMPPARGDGLGHAAAGRDIWPALVAAGIALLLLLPLGAGPALAVAAAMGVAGLALARLAMRQIGGQTGDVMGAMQQVAECAGWTVLVAIF